MSSYNLDLAQLELVENRANELMDKYHGCAQCVHVAIQEFSGLKDEGAIKAISGFSGGFGGIQSMCGALTGAALALGIKYGRDFSFLQGPTEEAIKKQFAVMEQVSRLAKWFEREYGSIYCNELRKKYMGTDLGMGIPWQKEWADSLGMGTRCKEMVAKTARRTLVMLVNPKLNILDKV